LFVEELLINVLEGYSTSKKLKYPK